MRALSHLPGSCFIGGEKANQAPVYAMDESTGIFSANRWSSLVDWLALEKRQGLKLDQNTVVVVDMDKTAIAARGRNANVIDNARVEGLHRTAAGLLGKHKAFTFDLARVQAAHNELKEPAYHPFTADNQDYLAYICLAVSAGLIDLPTLVRQVKAGEMRSFEQFIAWADVEMTARNPVFSEKPGFSTIHREVYPLVQAGDPIELQPGPRELSLAELFRSRVRRG